MSALEMVFVSEGNCQNCNGIRRVLDRVRHEYRHVAVTEVHPDDPAARSLVAEYGVRLLPVLIVNGRVRLVGEASEKQIRHEIDRVRPQRAH